MFFFLCFREASNHTKPSAESKSGAQFHHRNGKPSFGIGLLYYPRFRTFSSERGQQLESSVSRAKSDWTESWNFLNRSGTGARTRDRFPDVCTDAKSATRVTNGTDEPDGDRRADQIWQALVWVGNRIFNHDADDHDHAIRTTPTTRMIRSVMRTDGTEVILHEPNEEKTVSQPATRCQTHSLRHCPTNC